MLWLFLLITLIENVFKLKILFIFDKRYIVDVKYT